MTIEAEETVWMGSLYQSFIAIAIVCVKLYGRCKEQRTDAYQTGSVYICVYLKGQKAEFRRNDSPRESSLAWRRKEGG